MICNKIQIQVSTSIALHIFTQMQVKIDANKWKILLVQYVYALKNMYKWLYIALNSYI